MELEYICFDLVHGDQIYKAEFVDTEYSSGIDSPDEESAVFLCMTMQIDRHNPSTRVYILGKEK